MQFPLFFLLAAVLALVASVAGRPPPHGYAPAAGPFDASKQCLDLTGEHRFIPPGDRDIRGVCPGTNALANHGFIPRNGIATIKQLIDAQKLVYNTGPDLAALLAVYGTILSGSTDADHLSIGGPPDWKGLHTPMTEELVRKTLGLGSEHNSFEVDGSPTRGDLYELDDPNDVQNLRIDRFAQLYERQDGVPPHLVNYSVAVLGQHRVDRLKASIEGNKDALWTPFGAIAASAAHFLSPELFSKFSADEPYGRLDRDTLASFYGVEVKHTSSGHVYNYTVGNERIPDNWCKRPTNLTLDKFTNIMLGWNEAHPYLKEHLIGGNTGTNNSWRNIDIGRLTNGVYTNDSLSTDHRLVCVGLQQGIINAPEWLNKMYRNITKPYGFILANAPLFDYLNCPQASSIDVSAYDAFPGWNRGLSWPEWEHSPNKK